MENKDYEQLYYDEVYENRKLKEKITELENEIQDLNICRTKRNIDLQKYLVLQIKRKKGEDAKCMKQKHGKKQQS